MPHYDVLVLGAHPSHGFSMRRYTDMTVRAYRDAGYRTRVLIPTGVLSRTVPPALRKWTAYVEQFVFFPMLFRAASRRVDLIHVVDHSDSPYLTFIRSTKKTLVTCHDLIAVRAARGEIGPKIRIPGRCYQAWVTRSLRRATSIVAVSEQTRRDCLELVDAAMPTYVVPNPLGLVFTETSQELKPAIAAKYVLIVSTPGWRKRRFEAVRLWCSLRSTAQGRSTALMLIGPPLTGQELRIIEQAALDSEDILQKEGISELELRLAYEGAYFLIQVSKFEGFCWPILEANSVGTMALCADEPILRETGEGNVFLSATQLLNPDWTRITHELSDRRRRDALRLRAQEFTPARFSRQLSGVLVEQYGLWPSGVAPR